VAILGGQVARRLLGIGDGALGAGPALISAFMGGLVVMASSASAWCRAARIWLQRDAQLFVVVTMLPCTET